MEKIGKLAPKLLILLLLIATVSLFFEVQTAKADTLTFTCSSSDSGLFESDISYSTVHDQPVGVISGGSTFSIGQNYDSGSYSIYRGYVYFDTSDIPDTATISSAVLSLNIFSDSSTSDFNVTVQTGGSTYPHDPVQFGDYYYYFYAFTDGGSANTSTISGAGYWNITLSDTGEGWISKTGATKFCLRSSKDIASTVPTGAEGIVVYSSEGGYAAKLYVTYSVAEEDYYSYTFHGPFSEETGYVLNENVTVGVWSSEGGAYETFTLNGTYLYNCSTLVQFFQFTFADNSTREYWVDPSESSLATIYVFWGNTTSYAISFLDTTSILDTYPYVTVKRRVNGSLYAVEKRRVDEYNIILANLIAGRTYTVYLGNEDTSYIFGDLTVTATTSIQLTLRGVDFPKETLLTQKYVRCYAYRSSSIFIVFADSSEATNSVFIEILYSDFSTAYNTTETSNSFTVEWGSAVDNVTYVVRVTADHSTYGEITYKQVLLGDTALTSAPFSLSFLGDWGFDSSTLIPSLIILCVAGCFSALNAEAGAVLMCIVAIILTIIGWISISIGFLVAAITLAILMALVYSKRRGGMG